MRILSINITLRVLALLLLNATLMGTWACSCSEHVFKHIGVFQSKDQGVRESIKQLAQEINRCPDAQNYTIAWAMATEEQRKEYRAIIYDRETRRIGYEVDPGSGHIGDSYIVDTDVIRSVAANNGTLEDFAGFDRSVK